MEALRRIMNTSDKLPWESTVSHLNEYSYSMKISGYNKSNRFHAINGAIARYKEMKKEIDNGQRKSLFRNREEIIEAKKAKKT